MRLFMVDGDYVVVCRMKDGKFKELKEMKVLIVAFQEWWLDADDVSWRMLMFMMMMIVVELSGMRLVLEE